MLRIGLFWEEAFPTVDAAPPSLEALRRTLEGFDVHILGSSDLERLPALDLLVLPFGSAFPELGWPQIIVYLQAGGNLLTLGGAPFAVPCTRQHVVWKGEHSQPAYQRELGICQVSAVDARYITEFTAPGNEPILSGLREKVAPPTVFELLLWPAGDRDADAPRHDVVVRPLLYGRAASGRPIVAPVVALDHVDGEFAGGRWVLANMDGRLPGDAVRRLAFFSALGASDLTVAPSFACYYSGEHPRLTVHAGRLGPLHARHSARVTVTDPAGIERTCDLPPLGAGAAPAYRWTQCDGDLFGSGPLAPGLYTAEASLLDEDARELAARLRIPPGAQPAMHRHRSGFWVWDDGLMSAGSSLAAGTETLLRDGLPYPILGVAYPAPDPGRGSLADPYPDAWDADLAAMRKAGVTLLRVGTGMDRRRAMPMHGLPDEGYLRAIDALLLTARRHDLPVLFTLFRFPPEAWDSENPYLDPHAIAAQQDFAAALVSRYRGAPAILWEVTDTPSLLSPDVAPPVRPCGDAHEEQAWQEWLSHRPEEEIRGSWAITPRESLALPQPADFEPGRLQDAHPLKVLDYRLFAQAVHERWRNGIGSFVHVHPAQLQPPPGAGDGEGTADDGAPVAVADLAYARAEGAEADLLWRLLLARASGRPALLDGAVAGLIEGPDGRARGTDEERRNWLERVVALAVAAGCAGAVLPAWGVNVPCEGVIAPGVVRADGTSRPELDALAAISQFLSRNRQHLEGRELEPVVMLAPESSMLSPGGSGAPASRACVEVFHQVYPAGLRAAGEYALDGLGEPRLILLPSARILRQEAWEALLARVHAGACLLVTGPLDTDEHWQPCERLAGLGLAASTRSVAREESILVDGQHFRLRFGGDKPDRVDKAELAGGPAEVRVLPHGQGKVLFAPLPFELADNPEPLAALYGYAVRESGLERPFTLAPDTTGLFVRALRFRQAVLYALVSQASEGRSVEILHGGARLSMSVPAQRAVLLLVDRTTGAEIDRCAP